MTLKDILELAKRIAQAIHDIENDGTYSESKLRWVICQEIYATLDRMNLYVKLD